MLYTILSDVMTLSEDQAAVMTLEGRKDAEKLLWAELNKALTEKEMKVAADKVADFLISRSVVKSWLVDPYEAEAIANAETVLSHLKPYLHGLNLSHIKAEIKHKYNEKTAVTRQPFFIFKSLQIRLINSCLGRKSLYALDTALAAALGRVAVRGVTDNQTVWCIQTEAVFARLVKINLPFWAGK